MSILGEIARENDVEFFCKKIAEKIEKYPEAEKALKELGLEVLEIMPRTTAETRKYDKLFRE